MRIAFVHQLCIFSLDTYMSPTNCCPAATTLLTPPNTGAKTGKDSFFLATDANLLQIMRDQGLDWAVSYMSALKPENGRLGIDHLLYSLAERNIVTTGNIKDVLGELQLNCYCILHWCPAQLCCYCTYLLLQHLQQMDTTYHN